MSDFKVKNSIDSYYFSFEFTGCTPVDRILQSVASAGSGSHSTDGWSEDFPGKEFTLAEQIQVCANFASAEFEKLEHDNKSLQSQLEEAKRINKELESSRMEALTVCMYVYEGMVMDMTRNVAREWLKPSRDLYITLRNAAASEKG